MVGTIVNLYSKDRHEVEIVEVDSVQDGGQYLVNARELRGGKVWLNTFDPETRTQTSDMVSRFTLSIAEHPIAA